MSDVTDRLLAPQNWTRDGGGPCVSLGEAGHFDDMHIFAPCVAHIDDRYFMWYCGSQDAVEDRVFSLGLAMSDDGIAFSRYSADPVATLDNRLSVLTPTLLRDTACEPVRADGELRMFFSAADLTSEGDGVHTLREMRSRDGITWSTASEPMIENLYAPSVVFDGERYRLWYTDVAADPWNFRYAESTDGRSWEVHPEPVLLLDQEWEHGRMFYPYVLMVDGVWVMYYGAYMAGKGTLMTSLGIAVSEDGIRWTKSPANPVFGPPEDPSGREWESHYTTSQTVLPVEGGGYRIWYASREAPPFVHKYFAIGTARWDGPK